jgi:hypothetical protein
MYHTIPYGSGNDTGGVLFGLIAIAVTISAMNRSDSPKQIMAEARSFLFSDKVLTRDYDFHRILRVTLAG